LWYQTEVVLIENTGGVDFYNVQYNTEYPNSEDRFSARVKNFNLNPRNAAFDVLVKRKKLNFDNEHEDENDYNLTTVMGMVHEALSLPAHVQWGSQADAVFDTLAGDFMKPVINIVEEVLNNTSIKVVVYSGQLDLICATPGTVQWISTMSWYGSSEYKNARRNGIGIQNVLEGYSRQFGNFSMYWINKAGHMAPFDNPRAMGYLLRQVTNFG